MSTSGGAGRTPCQCRSHQVAGVEAGSSHFSLPGLGLALVLFALVIVWTTRVPRPMASLRQSWVIGNKGYLSTEVVRAMAAFLLLLAWSIGLLIVAWRRKESVQAVIG